jgi:hypothetical protein
MQLPSGRSCASTAQFKLKTLRIQVCHQLTEADDAIIADRVITSSALEGIAVHEPTASPCIRWGAVLLHPNAINRAIAR